MSDRPVTEGMLCPVCKLDLVMSERQGIEIDYCPKCRGVWLDRGELDKIIERSAVAEAGPGSAPQPAASPGAAPQFLPPHNSSYTSPDPYYGPGSGHHGGGHGGGHHGGGSGRHKSFLGRLFD